MRPTEALIGTELFNPATYHLESSKQAALGYLRAEAIARVFDLSLADIAKLGPKFWALHYDPILCFDGAATTLLMIQYNLCLGTLTNFAARRKDLRPLMHELLKFRVLGQFCLTEVGHGLDVYNLETTATLLDDGGFDLHTPTPKAAKYMPPTIPVLGRECIGVVFARLIVIGKDSGIYPFLVTLNDGSEMAPGVTARLLPRRHGADPMHHAITTFNHVKLPATALLDDFDKGESQHEQFLQSIRRVGVGALSLCAINIPAIQIAAHIAAKYSFRRIVHDPVGRPFPIMDFSTQRITVLKALAQAFVLKAFYDYAVKFFTKTKADPRAKHGVAAAVKAVAAYCIQDSHIALSERCGAQGLFSYNQIARQYSDARGMFIAEGDILVLCIRLATELILQRYHMPIANDDNHLLSKYEQGILEEQRSIAKARGHRSTQFASLVLPRCRNIVEAIGHRLAYEASLARSVPAELIEIYVCDVLQQNLAWYVEKGFLTRDQLARRMAEAVEKATPHINSWLEQQRVDAYVMSPIVDEDKWEKFVEALPLYTPQHTAEPLAKAAL